MSRRSLRLHSYPLWLLLPGVIELTVFGWHGGGFDLRLFRMRKWLTVVGYWPGGRRFNAWLSEDGTPTRATWMLRAYSDA